MNAIILAGGKGSRLVPWTAPKCLLPINGIPMLHRIIDHLIGGTLVNRIIICVGYRSSDVAASIGAHRWSPDHIKISDAGEDVSMGARLVAARELTDGGMVLVCYGDELADVNVHAVLDRHKDAAITFASAVASAAGGEVLVRPRVQIIENARRSVNIGFAVIEPRCWSLLRPEDGLSDWINRVGENETVRVYEHGGKRATVNSLADLARAEEMWQ